MDRIKEKMETVKMGRDYCFECDTFTDYIIVNEERTEEYKGKKYSYRIDVPKCTKCNSEMPVPGYADKERDAFFKAYRIAEGIISLDEIEELMNKYKIGKEPLAAALGLGAVTIKRYFQGQLPSAKNSELMFKALNNISFMEMLLDKNKESVGNVAYTRSKEQIKRLNEVKTSKLEQVANYIIQFDEITPLALQKLLGFVQGISSLINERMMFQDMCQAWIHGPVYPTIYDKYKSYCAQVIEPVADTEDLKTLIDEDDKKVIDLVMRTFGLYNGKILEFISHKQEPWIAARSGCLPEERCDNYILNDSISEYYKEIDIDTEEKINKYIANMLEEYNRGNHSC